MESTVNLDTHEDFGTISIQLLQDRRNAPEVSRAIYRGWVETIEQKVKDGVGSVFEEGPVFLQSSHRIEGGKAWNRACAYRMHFHEQCARMHVHPYGERRLEINPVSAFGVFSLSPFELGDDFLTYGRKLDEYLCPISNRVVFGIAIDAFVEFSVQIPKNTSHRFLGVACALSCHPDEISELNTLSAATSAMGGDQTAYWGSSDRTNPECKMG